MLPAVALLMARQLNPNSGTSLMLGADGVMLGSRLWASPEALVHPNHQRVALATNGDGTIRQTSADIARCYDWPAEFTGRVLRTAFVSRWNGREAEHRAVAEPNVPIIWRLWLKDGRRKAACSWVRQSD